MIPGWLLEPGRANVKTIPWQAYSMMPFELKYELYDNFVNHKKQPWEYGQLIWEMFKEQGIQPVKEW